MRILTGDALAMLRTLPEASFDGCLCDPPYGLEFMGTQWDHGVPGPEMWSEALRVLKPGAFLLAFGGTRTYHRLACAIEGAGFEIRDCIVWLYGQGFPKHGSCLKPAWEPIIVARKSGKGLLNIEGCRIGNENVTTRGGQKFPKVYGTFKAAEQSTHAGRWPANVILDEEAAAMLDEQSGISSEKPRVLHHRSAAGFVDRGGTFETRTHGDTGGASRFFYCAKASRKERNAGLENMPLRPGGSNAKGFTKDVAAGLDRDRPVANNHPTVKPLKLLEHLARLILPPEGDTPRRLLVPFSGSGSEMLGARKAGWDEITGIEREKQYVAIARQRLGLKAKAA